MSSWVAAGGYPGVARGAQGLWTELDWSEVMRERGVRRAQGSAPVIDWIASIISSFMSDLRISILCVGFSSVILPTVAPRTASAERVAGKLWLPLRAYGGSVPECRSLAPRTSTTAERLRGVTADG